jgi:disulfide bond formation protein DsbB
MKRIPTSLLWLAMALIGMALVAGSFIMVAWLKLQPCPLCIAQRTLFRSKWGQTRYS